MTAQTETLLQQARRHVREGEVRIARQEALVARSGTDGHADAATVARGVLETMRSSLDLMKYPLRQIEERSKS